MHSMFMVQKVCYVMQMQGNSLENFVIYTNRKLMVASLTNAGKY